MPKEHGGGRLEAGALSREAGGRSAMTLDARAGVLARTQTVDALVKEVARILHDRRHAAPASRLTAPALQEARDLLAALLDVPRHWPLLRANKWVEADVWRRAMDAARKRAAGAPLAYAVGSVNFRQMTLAVDERVLIPRPETELLVDIVLERQRRGIAVDVGTGSGAIALALATEGDFDRVIATDLSLDALDVAQANVERTAGTSAVEVVHGDLLAPVATLLRARAPNVIVSNPPYISFEEISGLPASVRDWEPMLALLSAASGLSTTARLVRQAAAMLAPAGLLALEVDARRASIVAELVSADERLENVSVHLDLTGRERFVTATRRDQERAGQENRK